MLDVAGEEVAETGHDDDEEREDLGGREAVLHARHPLDVVAVDDGQQAHGGGRQEPHGDVRRIAGGPQRLQDVLRERDGRDGVARGHQDEQRHPQVQEGGQRPEGLADVGVVAAGFRDHSA